MKKFILLSTLFLFSFACFSQSNCGDEDITSRGLLFNVGAGFTQFAEFDVHMESALIFYKQKVHVSLIADCFTAKKPSDRMWTTAQIGARLNYVYMKQSQTNGLIFFGSYKYVTQGHEQPGSLNKWVWDAGMGILRDIGRKRIDNVWLRADVYYENTPNGRLFCSLGIQTVL